MAKIFGTAVCVGGAMVMTFLKGPKLLHDSLGVGGAGLDLDDLLLLNSPASRNWVMGALFLVGSSSCWSLWLIIQVGVSQSAKEISTEGEHNIHHEDLNLVLFHRFRSANRTWIP